jgi:AcrR family transcriptional regulator
VTSELSMPAVPPRSRGRRQRSAGTRDAIAEAMRELLKTHRLDAVTVQEVVELAAVSRQTFYAHFETKYSVVAALVEEMGQVIYAEWASFLDGDGPLQEKELRQLGLVTLHRWREQATLFSATIEGWHSDQEIHDAWNEVLVQFAAALSARVHRVRKPKPGDDMLFPTLISLYERSVYLAVSAPDGPLGRSDNELAGVLAQIWLRSLGLD